MDAVGFTDRLAAADLVVTGEGRFDAQSLHGKVPAGVLREARTAGIPALILCGRAEVRPPGARVESLVEWFGERRATTEAGPCLEELAERLAPETTRAVGPRGRAEGPPAAAPGPA
jgi:glycerate kinase